MSKELYKLYRPKKFSKVLGQESAIATLEPLLKKNRVPHTILMSGPPGCGKTTMALILARKLKAKGNDCQVLDSAQFRGIDTIREIQSSMHLSPMFGDTKVWILDECHNQTRQAQESMLKMLEETPEHVFFILCTTDPQKVITAVRSRCTELRIKSLKDDVIRKILKSTIKLERGKVPIDVQDKIVEFSQGSARNALVFLHQVINLKSKKQMLAAIQVADAEKEAWDLNKLLLFDYKLTWEKISALLQNMQQEAETVRRIMIAGASTMARKQAKPDRYVLLIDCFGTNYYDMGDAGLTLSCHTFWKAVSGK